MTLDHLLPTGDGHTALPDEDLASLLPSYIATRGDLLEAEQRNIARALRRRPPTAHQLLDDLYLRRLHRAMFEDVWRWAGQYRRRETNIGIAPGEIAPAVRNLIEDVRAWIEFGTYPPDEIAVRFHHRLVAIHPFPNGNGRHGRIAADYLIEALGAERFSWGRHLAVGTDELRATYRRALQQADEGHFTALIEFVRS